MTTSIVQFIDILEFGEYHFATLKNVVIDRDIDGRLVYIAGGEAVIFRVTIEGVPFALKCYTVEKRNLKEKYARIKVLSESEPIIPKMTYLEKELSICDIYGDLQWVDILIYAWVEGVTLLQYIENSTNLYDKSVLFSLCHNFIIFARRILAFPFTHGDIKPQNIIIGNDGKMSLIDYDMAFYDDMPCDETVRTQWYQHPLSTSWDDSYSIATIVVSLFLISLKPLLFHHHHNGENIIIDTYKVTNKGTLNSEICSILAPYPNYMYLFDIVSSPYPLKRDILPILENIYGDKPSSCDVVDHSGELRRVVNGDGLYGFVDQNNKLVVGCCYGDATKFNDGVAGVRLQDKWYLFDVSGLLAVEDAFENIGVSIDGYMPVSKYGRWAYINSYTFKRTTNEDYQYLYPLSCGVGLACEEDAFFFINVNGNRIFGANTFTFATSFVGELAIVEKEKYYIIDIHGCRVSEYFDSRILRFDDNRIYYLNGADVVVSKEFCRI